MISISDLVETKLTIELERQKKEDFIDVAVPTDCRYSTTTITLLWITMMTNFPMLLIGYEWYRKGFSLSQVLAGTAIGCAILFGYSMLSAYMGAKSGLNYVLLIRQVFGKRGADIICSLWSLLFLGWYSLNAVLISDSLKGLFGLTVSTPIMAVVFVALMAFNNWFGFRGVANFARYLAAPVLVLWVGCALFKTLSVTPQSLLTAPSHQSFGYSLVFIPVLVIGASMWGNEADFFRFGQSSKIKTMIPIVVSVLIGELLFPVTGWLLARISGAQDAGAFTKFMNDYTFGHAPWLAAVALLAGYFALNDGNLYGAINGLENLWRTTRHKLVLALVALGSVFAVVFSYYASALDAIATLNGVLLPCVTMIISFEYFFSHKILGHKPDLHYLQNIIGKFHLPSSAEAPRFCWVAATALSIGWAIGIATSGIFPQLKALNAGVWILYAWLSSFAVYGFLRAIKIHKAKQALHAAELAFKAPAATHESTVALSDSES